MGRRLLARFARSLVPVLVLGLAALAVFLIVPRAPSESDAVKFEGFVDLPRSGLLSALDYLVKDGGHLFVASISSGDVLDVAVDEAGTPAVARVRTIGGGGSAHGVAVVASEQIGFITRAGLNAVDVFDRRTLRLVKRIHVAEDPDAVLYDAATNLVYVASGSARVATLIDARERRVVATIRLPGKPEFAALDSNAGLLYQNLQDTNTVVAIDLKKRAVVNAWPLDACDGPSGMSIDANARRLFVVCGGSDKLVVLNLETFKAVASIPLGRLSDSVVFDTALQRLYVAGGAGRLTVIQRDDGDGYRVLGKVATHVGAHTLALDPDSHKVYLACSGVLGSPRIAVFSSAPAPAPSAR